MPPCYSKNAILKGTVDFYCLVCETYLKSESDNSDHIAKPIHKKNLDSTQYVKDLEEDFIRKIKKRYFCELCNKLLPVMARVKIHINEQSHIDNKNKMFFKRIGANVIAFGKVVLNEKAWNGLNDESCAFCNTEYEDENIHKNLLSHILNIIQIKVEVDENKNIYRKIDDDSFQCLTCNMVLALNNIKCHFEEDQHINLYQECCTISQNKKNKDDCLAIPLVETGINTEQAHTASGSGVTTKCNNLEVTTAHAVLALNKVSENKQDTKTAISSVVKQESKNAKDSGDCVAIALNKTAETKEESKAVKDVDVNKKNKNLAEKKVKKNKTKSKPSELTDAGETSRSKSNFNIEEYEKKICKVLKTEDYITIDENGKTLCILCDWIMDPRYKKEHIKGEHHQYIEKLHKRRLAEMVSKNSKDNIGSRNRSILDLVSEFQANNVNINLIFNTAVCKKCTVNLPYDIQAIEEHIQKHNKETDKPENKVNLPSCEAIDKETTNDSEETNEVSGTDSNEKNKEGENLDSVEDKNENDKPVSSQALVKYDEELNLNETNLQDEAKIAVSQLPEPVNLIKQSLGYFIKILTGIKHTIFKDIIINDKICIAATSFHYLISIKGVVTCLVCDEEVPNNEIHMIKPTHIKLLNQKPVILNETSEFVREIRPELLHCGFCNMTVPSWSEMQDHFNSSLHKEIRNASEWRMQFFLDQYNVSNYYNTSAEFSVFSIRHMLTGLS